MTNFTRRDFLKISAAGTATAILAGCSQETERWVTLEPYVNAPEEQVAGVPNYYASTCRLCPAACGIVVRIMNGRSVKIEGNPEHPVSRGKLCARGHAGLQIMYNPDRVTGAVRQTRRGTRKYEPLPWNEAINTLIDSIGAAGSGVAVWLGGTTSGHLVDLFTRFTRALGTDAPVRYDLYTGFNGYPVLSSTGETLLGRPGLPTYDLGRADVVFSFGADFLGTWLSATGFGVEFGRFREQPFGKRGYLVQFEPKMSITGAKADRWVPAQPGSEALIAAAIARIIADHEFGSQQRVRRAAELTGEVDIEAAAAAANMTVEGLTELARVFGTADHPVAIPGSHATGGANAVEAARAVQMLNVIAGTVGQPGALSVTPDLPVETLAPAPVSSFADAQALIERMKAGEIKVLLVHGANPLYELPASSGFAEALEKVETVVSFASIIDETAVQADYVLPDRVYLEGWGYEVVAPVFDGLPVVSSQQPVVAPLYDIRSTGDVLLTIAARLEATAAALPWTDEVAFIKEQITALPAGAQGGEDAEVRWARFLQHGGWWPAAAPGVEVNASAEPLTVSAASFQGSAEEYPYYLYPYMTVVMGDGSAASTPWLQGAPDPLTTISWQTWIEMNPKTAEELDIQRGDVIRLVSEHGTLEAPVYLFPAIRPDTLAIPLGQGHDDLGRYARKRGANPVQLLGAVTDDSGQHLAWANVRVRIEKTKDKKQLAMLESRVDEDEANGEVHIPF